MPINFHDRNNRYTYTTRNADAGWVRLMSEHVGLAGIQAADIGCGGGIYTKALSLLGAAEVIGIDFSEAMLEGARAHCHDLSNCRFLQGNALSLPLEDGAASLVLERALIHHLSPVELANACREAYRVLDDPGTLVVQDRTPDDCLIAGSREHLRGYFFEQYPALIPKETSRRHSSQSVMEALMQAGFQRIEERQLWEIRERYDQFEAFRADLLNRTGRSILHELNDEELRVLADTIQQKTGYEQGEPVVEKDRWTLWFAYKE